MTFPIPRFDAIGLAALVTALSASAQNVGPSTSVSPYLLPSRTGVTTTSILTVNDPTSTIGGYKMVGLPDGLGAFSSPTRGKLTLLMNHELTGTAGIVRAGGYTGAFVSRWEIDTTTLAVNSGRDHNTSPSDVTWASQAPRAISRLCSGDLAAPSAYRFGVYGTDSRIYLNGEENGNEGTAWAHIATGTGTNASFELPALGRFSWENAVACPYAQLKTLVVGTDDSTPGQVYVYVGTKTTTGNDITRAGLTNGVLYGVRVTNLPTEVRSAPASGTFDLAPLGSQIGVTGAALQTASVAANVTSFLRPEDSCWDPRLGFQNNLYFATTDTVTANGGRSRLYRLTFSDITTPENGGTITCLLDGSEGQEMFDNLTVDSLGRILLQEDCGNNIRLGRVWLYDIATGSFVQIGASDPVYFQTGGPKFLTTDEETSGIIDAKDLLGLGWYLLDMQAHYAIPGELVEGGQLLALYVDPKITYPTGVESIGRSSPGCKGPVSIAVQAIPNLGNQDFKLICNNAPASAYGAVVFAASGLTTAIPFLGIELWANPAQQPFLSISVASDATGKSVLPLPIPANLFPGLTFVNQYLWLGPNAPAPCPPLGVSASNAVKVTIQA